MYKGPRSRLLHLKCIWDLLHSFLLSLVSNLSLLEIRRHALSDYSLGLCYCLIFEVFALCRCTTRLLSKGRKSWFEPHFLSSTPLSPCLACLLFSFSLFFQNRLMSWIHSQNSEQCCSAAKPKLTFLLSTTASLLLSSSIFCSFSIQLFYLCCSPFSLVLHQSVRLLALNILVLCVHVRARVR